MAAALNRGERTVVGVREKTIKVYTFAELSPEAKERAIRDFRDDPELVWDQSDSDMLTETFERDLDAHYGLGDMQVGWSLSHSQGDGVCFYGTLDVEKFIAAEKLERKFGPLVYRVNVKITNPGRGCHWSSMKVEVENVAREEDLARPGDLERIEEFERERYDTVERWREEWAKAKEEGLAPVRAWEERKARREAERAHWKAKRGRGPKAWLPGEPPPFDEPKPAPLPIPLPEKPEVPEPPDVGAARARVEDAWKGFEGLVGEFRAHLEGRIKEISREMEKAGYAEIEYHESDEYISDFMMGNEWEFLEDGERYYG